MKLEAEFAVTDVSLSGSTAIADAGADFWKYVLEPTTTKSADGARDTGVFDIVIGGPPGISVADGAMKMESELTENA